ncbi:hypothetical protein H3H39_05680 [Duganella sp. LX47W]|uniref:Methyl-accepting chemotaxis protein n=1 Tax=Rugamonas apoptosis TaxID=2758570 RepID=A0A7W2F7K1_9BURK|nr:hypothetical protein [Rugamonas apoptosis]
MNPALAAVVKALKGSERDIDASLSAVSQGWDSLAKEVATRAITPAESLQRRAAQADRLLLLIEQVAAQEIDAVANGSVALAERAGGLLSQIVPNISKTSQLVQQITLASAEQTAGVRQINVAINQLSMTTQQNSASSEQLASTAEEMSSQAEELHHTMSFFKVAPGA